MQILEVTDDVNRNASEAFSQVLAELNQSVNQCERIRVMRRGREEVAMFSLMMLQGVFGMRVLALRVAAYNRCLKNEAYASKFWREVSFN